MSCLDPGQEDVRQGVGSRAESSKAGLSAYGAAPTCEEMAKWNKTFAHAAEKLGISYESCAEANVPGVFKVGCISKKDYELLGLDVNKCTGKCG